MAGPDPWFTSASELASAIAAGERSPVAITEAFLDRIHERDTNAYVTVLDDAARERAREAEHAVEAGEDLGPLHGVPIAIKDLFAFKAGVPHTFGSRAFADYVPDRSAAVVERLEDAGAVVLGKTNTPEFGNRPMTDNDLVGVTETPFAAGRIAGGTSGGSAAAVADGLAPLAQGSDAGGSVRIPAACCGVYGLKPSFGRVPNGPGANAFGAHTPFTQHGPLARTVEDAALFLDVVAGPHPADPFTHPDGGEYRAAVGREVDDLSVAYSPGLGLFALDPDVRAVVDDAVDALAAAGAAVERVDPDYDADGGAIRDAWRTFFQLLMADVAAEVETMTGTDPLRGDPDPLFRRMAEMGRELSAMDVVRADLVRTAVYEAVQSVLTGYDLLVSATLAVPPFAVGETGPTEIDGRPTDPHIDWILTWPFNMTDHPAASVPAGFVDGLPVGAQVVGRRFADADVLAASAAVERVRPWHDAYPPSA